MKSIATLAVLALVTPTLTSSARSAQGPWRSLFDGKSLDAWRTYKSDAPPKKWEIKDGMLTKEGNASDLISKDQFGDFELELEWNIGEEGNSGIFYRGTEEYNAIYWSAVECQLLDNVKSDDNKKPNHLAGSAYDLFAAPAEATKPAGQWNLLRIVAKGNHIEHWMNGTKVVSYDIGSPEWEAALKASKFTPYPNFAKAAKGYLGIQGNHPGSLKLRNIRIRDLS
jgi:3-keto-disaccharide hydrolase